MTLSKEREGRITASLAGALLGQSPWMTPEQAMRAMVRNAHGNYDEFTSNIAIDYGNSNEPIALMQYQQETGHFVESCGFVIHKDNWIGATPDGVIRKENGILEIKCPFGRRKDADFKSIHDQPHYYTQVQIQMYCTGADFVDFFQWSKYGSKTERIYPDIDWLNLYIPELRSTYDEFLEEFDNPDHMEPLRKELNNIELRKLVDEYDQARDSIALLQDRNKEILERLVEESGGVNSLICGRKLTSVAKVGSVAYAKIVKEKLPDLDLEKYRGKPSKYWRFT